MHVFMFRLWGSRQDRREGGGSQGSYQGGRCLRGPVKNKIGNFFFVAVFFRERFQARGPTNRYTRM